MKNPIINLLDLKQENIENIDILRSQTYNTINVRLTRQPCKCPQCLKYTSKVKEYRQRKYVHQIINGTDTYINYDLRRMLCPYCGKTFNESNSFNKSYSSITNITLISILKDLKHYTSTYSAIAKHYNISSSTVVRVFDNHVQIKRHPCRRLFV